MSRAASSTAQAAQLLLDGDMLGRLGFRQMEVGVGSRGRQAVRAGRWLGKAGGGR